MEISLHSNSPPTSTCPKPPKSQQLFSNLAANSLLVKALQTNHEDSPKCMKHPLSSNIAIEPTTPATLPSFRHVITLLLPIRYPDKFYKESIADTTSSSLSHVALWRDQPRPGKRKHSSSSQSPTAEFPSPSNPTSKPQEPKVIGGIQCRLEPVPSPTEPEQHLYIQTLAVLSPYRGLGVATHLLDTIIATIIQHHKRVTEIYAHVWEANEEALEWYLRRGFVVEKEVVEGYYRRLRPRGARVVRRRVGVGDHLAVKRGTGGVIAGVGDVDGQQSADPADNLIAQEGSHRTSLEAEVQEVCGK